MRNENRLLKLVEENLGLACSIREINGYIIFSPLYDSRIHYLKKVYNKSKEVVSLQLKYDEVYDTNVITFELMNNTFNGIEFFINDIGLCVANLDMQIINNLDDYEIIYILDNINSELLLYWMHFYPGSFVFFDDYQLYKVKSNRYDYKTKNTYAVLEDAKTRTNFEIKINNYKDI